MADSTVVAVAVKPRHAVLVRVTHWVNAVCFFALLLSGVEILISHPRFYWGEVGNPSTPALFQIPIPASRSIVNTGYGYVLPDQNGWSRSLHFQTAWLVAATGLLYLGFGFLSGHFRRNLIPSGRDLRWTALSQEIGKHLRFQGGEGWAYNSLQRVTYLGVVFGLFPLLIWTGLAMSPGFTAAFPFTVTSLGGHQSARTIHFFATVALVLFVVIHVVMVYRSGFLKRMKAMTAGGMDSEQEQI